MLDFNHRPQFHEQVTNRIDLVLDAERRQQTPRDYLGASRLGVAMNERCNTNMPARLRTAAEGFQAAFCAYSKWVMCLRI